jgi:UDP-glucose 4-epimerase
VATVLVTGGAGYVGSHCCAALAKSGHDVIAFDDLSNGHAEFVRWGPLERGDIRDKRRLAEVFKAHRPSVVVHCAALIDVADSMRRPASYYDVNVGGVLTVLEAMVEAGVNGFVLSSTCAVYGAPLRMPMDEAHPRSPVNPYGHTKLAAENLVEDFARAHGMKYALLRYFNAAGAAADECIGERREAETHALPLALFSLLGRRERFRVYGCDYDTPDGSCLRDYVHVLDLADAHVRAIDHIAGGGDNLTVNLGSGAGVSVLELLSRIEQVTGRRVPYEVVARRPGDPPALVADIALAKRELGWQPQRGIDDIVRSAWKWHAEIEPSLFP